MVRVGTALIVLGLLAIAYGALWELGLAPGSRVTLPEPVALERAGPGTREVSAALPPEPTALPPPTAVAAAPDIAVPTAAASGAEGSRPAAAAPLPTLEAALAAVPALVPTPTAPVFVIPRPVAADAAERVQNMRPPPGYAVRLAIPAINVDTVVEQGGIVDDAQGEPVWETLPFVAVHYGDLTAMIGAPGNAVIAGHVVTLSEGNVFRFLYKLEIGDQVSVWDQMTREHDFEVVDVKLVSPSDTSVMDRTPDETLTLITCGGTFDPRKREFSERLIVTAKPL